VFFVRFSPMQRGHQRLCVAPNIATSLVGTRAELRRYGKVMVAGPLTVSALYIILVALRVHQTSTLAATPYVFLARCLTKRTVKYMFV
jgi:hypothetical protein